MALFKHVWNFSSNPAGEWSEVHHHNAADIGVSISVVIDDMIQARLAVLHPVNDLDSIDVLPVHPGGPGHEIPIRRKGTSNFPDQGGPANLAEAAVIPLNGSPVGTRKLWLRGMAEDVMSRYTNTGATKLMPAFRQALVKLRSEWEGAEYGVLVRTHAPEGAPGAAVGKLLISKIKYNADGTTLLYLLGAGNLPAANDYLAVNATPPKLFPNLNRVHRVIAWDGVAATVKIEHRGVPAGVEIDMPTGYAFKVTWSVNKYVGAGALVPYLGSRQTKNEDTGTRGARSARGGRA